MNPNRVIYETRYTPRELEIHTPSRYDERMVGLRFAILEQYGANRDVLDLCCGTGSYLVPLLDRFKHPVGLDFSRPMLRACATRLRERGTATELLLGDATSLPLADASFDFVFSYASLYYVPDVARVIKEIARVLRSGGHAVLELGNQYSLNTVVTNVQHRTRGWAKSFHIPATRMRAYLRDAGLEVVEWRSFQVLPMYGTPARLVFLLPFLTSAWKRLLGVRIRGRMLDEWISSSWPLRYVAFRHLIIVSKS
jgi:ubiquinone/menaquinone biosynthesis C-methylase UbiE